MSAFNEEVERREYERCSQKKETCLEALKEIIIASNSPLEGNSFYIHNSLNIYSDLYTKQLNLFWCGKQGKQTNTRICEIGFNAGHSCMLMLLGRENTPLDFTVFDIGHHSYTKPCLAYMETVFQNVKFEYIEGDSTMTMPKWIKANAASKGTYDVVHVDGGHSEHCIYNDMKNADALVKVNGILIVDDTNIDYISKYVDLYVSSGNYRELNILKTIGYQHRILQKIKSDQATTKKVPLTITTLVIGADYKKSLSACLQSKAEYAKKHGYTYIEGGEKTWDRKRPIAWSKIPFLLDICTRLPEGALIWQSDADVYITNPEISFEEHVLPLLPNDKDFLLTFDACGHINDGNIVFRNTAWSRDFWTRVYEQTQYMYHIWWENAAIIHLLETVASDREKIEVTPHHKVFNAYLRGVDGQPLWEKGDFLVHFAGVYDAEQMRVLVERIQRGETPRISM